MRYSMSIVRYIASCAALVLWASLANAQYFSQQSQFSQFSQTTGAPSCAQQLPQQQFFVPQQTFFAPAPAVGFAPATFFAPTPVFVGGHRFFRPIAVGRRFR